jgi:hypothetical protein
MSVGIDPGTCGRCGREVSAPLSDEGAICTGCLTLDEDIAETAAFAAACGRAVESAPTREVAERAQRWAELALMNLVRRQSVGYDGRPLPIGPAATR